MIPFTLAPPAESAAAAAARVAADDDAAFLAGGTTMADLMKLNVLFPGRLEYVRPALSSAIEEDGDAPSASGPPARWRRSRITR